jgi:hypothetical protein
MLHSAIERAQRAVKTERRDGERHDVHIRSVVIDTTLQDERITIVNISMRGLLASGKGKFQIGATVNFDIPDLGAINATIRWAGNGLLGCEFRDPIDPASFFHFVELQKARSLA